MGPNLTDRERLNSDSTYEAIVALINTGFPESREHPDGMLPKGRGEISDKQVRAVAAYVWTLSQTSSTSSSERLPISGASAKQEGLPEGITAATVEEGRRIFAGAPPSRP